MNIEQSNQSYWIPLADMMTGLMIIFMLLTAVFMVKVEQENKKVEQENKKVEQENKKVEQENKKVEQENKKLTMEYKIKQNEEQKTTFVVKEYESTKSNILLALQEEFSKDLKQWNAEVLGDMTIRFNDPSVLFRTGSSELRPRFQEILSDFFPRYISLLTSDKYKNNIKEIRIEGHTSIFWNGSKDEKEAYFKNMELSQARTRSTLEYLFSASNIQDKENWLIQHVTANGLSSSHPISKDPSDTSNQRVEFRIVTNANEQMDTIAQRILKK